MESTSFLVKRKLVFFLVAFVVLVVCLIGRVMFIQVFRAEELQAKAWEQQTRDRLIAPQRGSILDRNGIGIAETKSVCSISVINSQIKNKEDVALILAQKLELDYDTVLQKVNKRVALERIKTKVDKEIADEIRKLNLSGVVIDEDIKRVYPFSNLASQVIGFVGKDNQGIIGLESKYEKYLKGTGGKILTETDVKGIELANTPQVRQEPVPGYNLVTTIDVYIQQYVEQALEKIVEAKDANRGTCIILNPQNGEIYAMASKPDFDLNDPFTINSEELEEIWDIFTQEEQNDYLNKMWRNFNINDTYEPGSTFKIVTSAAGLEEGVVTLESTFSCPGFSIVEDRMIRCWRYPRSHGHETFVEGVQNSCNPVFMSIAERLGAVKFYEYLNRFGFNSKTGIDLPGEAVGIMHNIKNVGPVELATMSFGQSFQITPLQLLRAASAIVNGGYLITPHVGKELTDITGEVVETFLYEKGEQIISEKTSDEMRATLESVVSIGTGNRTYIPGYRIGGKTATSEKLPRKSGKYIASFMAFAPAENPTVMAIVLVDEPKGTYYGGQVTGPVVKEILENVLPYIGIEPVYTEEELKMKTVGDIEIPELTGLKAKEAKLSLEKLGLKIDIKGGGDTVNNQFPKSGEKVNHDAKIIVYTE